MDRKMECPICEKKAVFVGVHDDEGNYHGLMGCEYENAPWSGLSYALHHEGWGDCPLCTDGAESTMGGMLFDTAEEAISALSPPNEPLTLEELREVLGEVAVDEAVIELGVRVLRIEAFVEPLFGASIVASGVFQGTGSTLVPMLLNFGTMWGIRVPLSAILAAKWGLVGVWVAMALQLGVCGICFLIRLAGKRWLPKETLQ